MIARVKSYDDIINKTNSISFVFSMTKFCGKSVEFQRLPFESVFKYTDSLEGWYWKEEWLEPIKTKFVEIKE